MNIYEFINNFHLPYWLWTVIFILITVKLTIRIRGDR